MNNSTVICSHISLTLRGARFNLLRITSYPVYQSTVSPKNTSPPRLFPLVATHFPFYRGIISLLNYINLGIAASINLHFICCSLFDGKAITHANILCSYSIYLSIYSYPRKSTLSSPSSVVCTVSNKSTGIIYNPIKVYLKQKYEL